MKSRNVVYERRTIANKVHIQYDKTKNYVIHTNIRLNWARIVNRKTYNGSTIELIEDLVITPGIFIDVLIRSLPDGVTYINTAIEYGGMPNITGINEGSNRLI